MATLSSRSFDFYLDDNDFNRLDKKLKGHISKKRKNDLHKIGDKMRANSKNIDIKVGHE